MKKKILMIIMLAFIIVPLFKFDNKVKAERLERYFKANMIISDRESFVLEFDKNNNKIILTRYMSDYFGKVVVGSILEYDFQTGFNNNKYIYFSQSSEKNDDFLLTGKQSRLNKFIGDALLTISCEIVQNEKIVNFTCYPLEDGANATTGSFNSFSSTIDNHEYPLYVLSTKIYPNLLTNPAHWVIYKFDDGFLYWRPYYIEAQINSFSFTYKTPGYRNFINQKALEKSELTIKYEFDTKKYYYFAKYNDVDLKYVLPDYWIKLEPLTVPIARIKDANFEFSEKEKTYVVYGYIGSNISKAIEHYFDQNIELNDAVYKKKLYTDIERKNEYVFLDKHPYTYVDSNYSFIKDFNDLTSMLNLYIGYEPIKNEKIQFDFTYENLDETVESININLNKYNFSLNEKITFSKFYDINFPNPNPNPKKLLVKLI